MREPTQESTDLRMLADLFPRCDNPTTVTEYVQTCLHDVAIRAAKRLEAAVDDQYRLELYIEKLHSVLGITDTPMKAAMDADLEDLRERFKVPQEALQAITSCVHDEITEDAPMLRQYPAEDLLEAVGAARTAFECLCHSIVSAIIAGDGGGK